MPRSAVIYVSRSRFEELEAYLSETFEDRFVKPYTLSYAQRTEGDRRRVRITELADDLVLPGFFERAKEMDVLFASTADKDVRNRSYEELIDDGDRFSTMTTLQFVSPTLVDVMGLSTPFPVLSAVMNNYLSVWNTFAPAKFPLALGSLQHLTIIDFKVSCMPTQYGVGAQGWVTCEIRRGATEEYLGCVNALLDFAFYSGTGLHTEKGLGQTRRIAGKVQRAK